MKASSFEAKESRKRSKPLKERKRRARINNALLQLKTIILQAVHPELVLMSKLEKADLLEMANAYILHLQNSATKSTPRAVSTYSLGFNECAAEVMRYMERMEATSSSTTDDDKDTSVATASGSQEGDTSDRKGRLCGDLHSRLLEHLSSFASKKEMVERCAIERGWVKQSAQSSVCPDKNVTDNGLQIESDSKTISTEEQVKSRSKPRQRKSAGRQKLVTIRPKPTCSTSLHVNGIEVSSPVIIDPTPLPPIQSFLSDNLKSFPTNTSTPYTHHDHTCVPQNEEANQDELLHSDSSLDKPCSVGLASESTMPTSSTISVNESLSVTSLSPMVPSESDIDLSITPPCLILVNGPSELVATIAAKIDETPKDVRLPLCRQPIRKRLAARFCSESPSSNVSQSVRNSNITNKPLPTISQSKRDEINHNAIETMDHKTYTVLSNCRDSNVEQMVARTTKALSQTHVSRSMGPAYTRQTVTPPRSRGEMPLSVRDSFQASSTSNAFSSDTSANKKDDKNIENTNATWLYSDGYGYGFTQNGIYNDQMWRPW